MTGSRQCIQRLPRATRSQDELHRSPQRGQRPVRSVPSIGSVRGSEQQRRRAGGLWSQVSHIGNGIADNDGQGIEKGETITIDLSNNPVLVQQSLRQCFHNQALIPLVIIKNKKLSRQS